MAGRNATRSRRSPERPAETLVAVDYEILPKEECLRLLAAHEVGRLAFVDGDQPVVLPVNYVLDDETVTIRTDLGEKLSNVPLRRVAFEIDDIAVGLRDGWSVLVKGIGEDVSSSIDPRSEHLRTLPLTPWAPGAKDHWLRIVATEITGRRLHRPMES